MACESRTAAPSGSRLLRLIGVAIASGLSLNFLHIDPVKALYWSAILNGLVAAPLMAVIMLMASNPKVMGKFVIPAYLRWVGWSAAAVMLCCSVSALYSVGGPERPEGKSDRTLHRISLRPHVLKRSLVNRRRLRISLRCRRAGSEVSLGTWRAPSAAAKYASFTLKPAHPAKMLFGNCCT